MIDTHVLKKRELYLKKIIAFQDTEPVKVVTGIRRCGKSSLLKLMTLHLKENGVSEEQILEMNFESYAFKDMNSDDFYKYVKAHIIEGKRMYLFFDEVQRVPNWEDAINSFRVDFNCDIYHPLHLLVNKTIAQTSKKSKFVHSNAQTCFFRLFLQFSILFPKIIRNQFRTIFLKILHGLFILAGKQPAHFKTSANRYKEIFCFSFHIESAACVRVV